jgi:putative ABC transport system permease protein
MIAGIAVSLLLGLLGGIFPAVRAARIPVATALRQL